MADDGTYLLPWALGVALVPSASTLEEFDRMVYKPMTQRSVAWDKRSVA
jgi:hypothetical protein